MFFSKKKNWYPFVLPDSWPANGIQIVEVHGKKVAIAKYENEYFAFQAYCPHAGASLLNGYIDTKACIVCPLHGYHFKLKNGLSVSGEDYKMKVYRLEKRENGGWYMEL